MSDMIDKARLIELYRSGGDARADEFPQWDYFEVFERAIAALPPAQPDAVEALVKAAEAFAVIDPNWGDPVPLLTTIRETEEEAISAALVTKERGASLYSGYADSCVPPMKGNWDRMKSFGYKVAPIAAAIRGGAK